MKTHFILFAMCGLGLLINAKAMTVEDKEDDEFHHGFSMSDEMDEDEEILSLLNDQEMEDDDVERMADPLRIHIRIRRPQPLGFGPLGGGLGLSGGFELGFDEDESHEDEGKFSADDEESSMRSSDSLMSDDDVIDDDERNAHPVKIHFHIRRPSFRRSFDPTIEMKEEDIKEVMAYPQFRIRLKALFGRPVGFGRRLRVFFGRRRPFFFDNLNNDGPFSETQPATDDIFSEKEENVADPVAEDVKIQARIGVPGRGRFSRFRRPRISLDEMTTKPKKLSPLQLLARVRARSALLRQRFGLLSSNSFWCRRFGSVKCGRRRRPFIPGM